MPTKICIVGGVAGGASAAARARRLDENAEIIVFEKGEFISFANCGLPYHIGLEIKDRSDLLVTTPEALRTRFGIDVRNHCEVISIDPENKIIEVKDLKNHKLYTEEYDKLILSPGAAPLKPPLHGISLDSIYSLRNIPDMDEIKTVIDKKQIEEAVIVGGGFIGLEMAENLITRDVKVTVVEMLEQVMAPIDVEMASLVQTHLVDKGVNLHLGDGVKSFEKRGKKTYVTTQGGTEIPCDMVILSIGVRPEIQLAKNAGLEIGKLGGIKTDEHMRTSNPDIFAVGDVVEVKDYISGAQTLIPLAGPANKQGRIAAENALGGNSVYKGTQGTSIVKVFDLVVAATGMNEKNLKRNNIPYLASYNHASSHASYYPGSTMMAVKITFDPGSGKLFGAQIVGIDGVDKRIDVFATAIRSGMTVFDLEELELAYAPPFSSAKDPVNMAGFVAGNILRKYVDVIRWDEVDCLDYEKNVILDVRGKAEVRLSGTIPGSINIPVDEIRNKLNTLDKSKTYIVMCASGQRSYVACRILNQHGFKTKNLSGGWKTYDAAKKQAGKALVQACLNKSIESSDSAPKGEIKVEHEINACGIQCPGPIMKLKAKMDEINIGDTIKICASDSGFPTDAKSWCMATGNELVSIESDKGTYTAIIRKGSAAASDMVLKSPDGKEITIIVFSDDLDRALASFIIANGAASIGSKVNMFFTFWGLNVLKKKDAPKEKKDLLSTMFGSMMPKGPDQLALSKMHFGGLGTSMMKYVMENKNVESLDALIESAREQGIKLIACTMTMEIMGIKKSELIDDIEEGGVATYLERASQANVNLFI
ncbi:MAG: FAD-dependent oxidoreductase [Firmicutes bacterium]|nr:FAD-dependent oxidoreductase [Bacillota bacterium]